MFIDGKACYASAVLFNTLENDVFENIAQSIKKNTNGNPSDDYAVLEALKYNGDVSKLTPDQKKVYDKVVNDYIKKKKLHGNNTITDIYGGFTENKLIVDPATGKRVYGGHNVIHPISGGPMWYDQTTNQPTGAQNQEFFGSNFQVNVMQNNAQINNNSIYYPNATTEMDNIVSNAAGKR